MLTASSPFELRLKKLKSASQSEQLPPLPRAVAMRLERISNCEYCLYDVNLNRYRYRCLSVIVNGLRNVVETWPLDSFGAANDANFNMFKSFFLASELEIHVISQID